MSYKDNVISIDKPIRLIELFAGYGSQALALDRIGAEYEQYKVVENDKFAIRSYNAIHKSDFVQSDITQTKGIDLHIVDSDKYEYILTYSFPCQSISIAGRKKGMEKGSGTRSGLLWEVERLLLEIKADNGELPQILLMENVPQILSQKNKPAFDQWVGTLRSIGYSSTFAVLDTQDFGIPQHRNRCFMVSTLGKKRYEFPNPITLRNRVVDILEDDIDLCYYINTDKAKAVIESVVSNGKYHDDIIDGIEKYGNVYNSNFTGMSYAGNVYNKYGISPALRTAQGGGNQPMFIESVADADDRMEDIGITYNDTRYVIRKLTPIEYGKLMGLKVDEVKDMLSVNSKSQVYKQIGNSIAIDCLVAIFKNMNIQGIDRWS